MSQENDNVLLNFGRENYRKIKGEEGVGNSTVNVFLVLFQIDQSSREIHMFARDSCHIFLVGMEVDATSLKGNLPKFIKIKMYFPLTEQLYF